MGKEENAGYQHFLLFPQCFQKASPLGSLKVGIVWYRVKMPIYSKTNKAIVPIAPNPLPNNKMQELSKFKLFEDKNVDAIQNLKFVLE